jgi:hypothetical protein
MFNKYLEKIKYLRELTNFNIRNFLLIHLIQNLGFFIQFLIGLILITYGLIGLELLLINFYDIIDSTSAMSTTLPAESTVQQTQALPEQSYDCSILTTKSEEYKQLQHSKIINNVNIQNLEYKIEKLQNNYANRIDYNLIKENLNSLSTQIKEIKHQLNEYNGAFKKIEQEFDKFNYEEKLFKARLHQIEADLEECQLETIWQYLPDYVEIPTIPKYKTSTLSAYDYIQSVIRSLCTGPGAEIPERRRYCDHIVKEFLITYRRIKQ